MNKRNIYILFFALILTSISWIALIPIWHTPDEQAHFAQVAFLAEKGENPKNRELDLTEEIFISESLLKTERDNLGNNKFTHNPSFRIEYSKGLIGVYEASISALANTKSQEKFVKNEASGYPELYYLPAAFIYKLLKSQNLFIRVFLLRFYSLLFLLLTFIFIYKAGRLFFPSNRFYASVLTVLAGFQPMIIFSNIGVTSDNIGILFFTIFLYLSCYLLIRGVRKKYLFFLFSCVFISVYTKPQFVIVIPIAIFLFVYLLLCASSEKDRKLIGIFLAVFLASSGVLYINSNGPFSIIQRFMSSFDFVSLLKYTREYTLSHTFREVMPWYWGVFNWLGVTYPRLVHRVINRIVLVSIIGIILWFLKLVYYKRIKSRKVMAVFFLIFSSLVFFCAISFYDWLSWKTTRFPLGVQGRYFLPLILPISIFLMIGIANIFPNKYKLRILALKILSVSMMIFNVFALLFVSGSYYSYESLQVFLNQASQYKPWFLKGNLLLFLLLLSLILLIYYSVKLILMKENSLQKRNLYL